MQKARRQAAPIRRPEIALRLLVGIRFQVLFTPLAGVLFTFPSRYYPLSVTSEYLALGDGPPGFLQGFSCPAVLRYPLRVRRAFTYVAITLCGRPFQAIQLAHGLVTLLLRALQPRALH